DFAALADGRLEGRLRRGSRRMDAGRCAWVLANPGAPWPLSQACGRARASLSGGLKLMKSVVVDKIASVTQACGLSHELRISTDIPCEEGVVLVVELLNNKSTYNTLELTSGRMAKVARGDIVVGALGNRKALFGYSGHLPESVKAGDVVQLLNIGGVLGICDSVTAD